MTHRVHTILSILAEDHAPAALRPSLLLAIDWPTVAEEAPATGDDALFAAAVAGILSFGERARENLSPRIKSFTTVLAARLATVAASLTTTGDKAHALHAAALWGAAAALVGLTTSASSPANVDPSTAEVYLRALAHKANGLMFGMSRTTAEQAAIIGTVIDKIKAHEFTDHEHRRAAHDKALADIHALRDILKVPAGGNLVDHASAFAERHMRRVDEATAEAHRVNEDNARLRAQVDRMIAARDIGSEPEAWWRKAMREWMANHATKSHAPDRISCPHRQDGDASACDHCCMFG